MAACDNSAEFYAKMALKNIEEAATVMRMSHRDAKVAFGKDADIHAYLEAMSSIAAVGKVLEARIEHLKIR